MIPKPPKITVNLEGLRVEWRGRIPGAVTPEPLDFIFVHARDSWVASLSISHPDGTAHGTIVIDEAIAHDFAGRDLSDHTATWLREFVRMRDPGDGFEFRLPYPPYSPQAA